MFQLVKEPFLKLAASLTVAVLDIRIRVAKAFARAFADGWGDRVGRV
jgi:hypothetical protein